MLLYVVCVQSQSHLRYRDISHLGHGRPTGNLELPPTFLDFKLKSTTKAIPALHGDEAVHAGQDVK